MKYLLIFLLVLLISCDNTSEFQLERCKRLDTETIEYIPIYKEYRIGDTIMYRENSWTKENKYVILPNSPNLK